MTDYVIRHGPRRYILRPWRLDCACGFDVFPCPPVRLGIARPAVRTRWATW